VVTALAWPGENRHLIYITTMKRTAVVRPRRGSPILICKKCLKRSSDGANIRHRLKRELKHGVGATKKPARLVPTGYFKICPKAAVVLASGLSLAQGKYVLLSHHGDAEAALGLLQSPD